MQNMSSQTHVPSGVVILNVKQSEKKACKIQKYEASGGYVNLKIIDIYTKFVL